MWSAVAPRLRQRLSDATAQTSMTGRLRGWFIEITASGRTGIGEASRDLGVIPWRLQRWLAAEETGFQLALSAVPEQLATKT